MSQFINRNSLRLRVMETIKLPWTWEAKFRRLADYIKGMPSEEVVPVVHGWWLPTKDDNKKRCNQCDIIHLIAQYPHGQINYCPNCGAKMDACAGKCEYAQMMERNHGKVLTPENCGLHRDKMCPKLD